VPSPFWFAADASK